MVEMGFSRWMVTVGSVVSFACGGTDPGESPGGLLEGLHGDDCEIDARVRVLPAAGTVHYGADGVNDRGDVAGSILLEGSEVGSGAIWDKHDRLLERPGPSESPGLGMIDDHRRAVGQVVDANGAGVGFVWSRNRGVVMLEALAPPGKPHTDAPRAMNDRGQVVGRIETDDPDAGGVQRAVIWSVDGPILEVLGTFGGSQSDAKGINDAGVVVGTASKPSDQSAAAFRWTRDTGMSELSLPADVVNSEALAINASGEILVSISRDVGPRSHGILRVDGTFDEIPIPIDHQDVIFTALNDDGWVVGNVADSLGGAHPYVWNRALEPTPLPLPAGELDVSVQSLNNRGTAVGSAFRETGASAVAWSLRCRH